MSKLWNMSIIDLQLTKWYKWAQRKFKARKAENLEQCFLDTAKFSTETHLLFYLVKAK